METTADSPRRNASRWILAVIAGAIAVIVGAMLVTSDSAQADVPATVIPLEHTVTVRPGAAGTFSLIRTKTDLRESARVKTGVSGLAEIRYFDGSLTRLGPATEYELEELKRSAQSRQIAGRLDVGRAWHNVTKVSGSASRWEVRTSTAVAAVRGTALATVCLTRDTCEISVIEGTVDVSCENGDAARLGAGQAATATDVSDLAGCSVSDAHEIDFDDPWLTQNAARDGIDMPADGAASGADGDGTTTGGGEDEGDAGDGPALAGSTGSGRGASTSPGGPPSDTPGAGDPPDDTPRGGGPNGTSPTTGPPCDPGYPPRPC